MSDIVSLPAKSVAELRRELFEAWRAYAELKAAFLSLQTRHAALAEKDNTLPERYRRLQIEHELLQTQFCELQKSCLVPFDLKDNVA
jgi:hypothetical protein